jgi:hypothetical protein
MTPRVKVSLHKLHKSTGCPKVQDITDHRQGQGATTGSTQDKTTKRTMQGKPMAVMRVARKTCGAVCAVGKSTQGQRHVPAAPVRGPCTVWGTCLAAGYVSVNPFHQDMEEEAVIARRPNAWTEQ